MGTDNAKANVKTKYQVIADALEQQIELGRFDIGEKLPSIRQLASNFNVSKNTAINALQQLESKSLIEANPKSGFTVKHNLQSSLPVSPVFTSIRPNRISIPELLQDVISRGAAFDIKPSAPLETEYGLIGKLHQKINKSMRTQSVRNSRYYDDPKGNLSLREQIAQRYARLGLTVDREDICITAGCQHSLCLSLMATCKPGDNVVIESPGFYGVIQLLEELQLNAIEVPCHNLSGLDIELLRDVLEKYNVRACVVTPAFSTPTGACMPDENKVQLLSLAQRYDFAVIEDDIYGELGFKFRPKPIKFFDVDERVILCSSFSKSLSVDLRTGWIIGSRWEKRIQRLKMVTHLAGSQAIQMGLSEFISSGNFTRYLKQRTIRLEEYRNALARTLHQEFGASVRYTLPLGGLSLWVQLPNDTNTLALYYRALEHKIVLTPGALFSSQDNFSNFLRISFCHPLTPERASAIHTLHTLTKRKKQR
ncbi:PLP-dependent aminotransferase family protein [Aliiglaciecola lipolytica]|uniref:aminotransferase-like domain-containing protein n=1 Tax=Aliiglaciecola lipolytica TaxID=477689 RepID=UPI001C082AC6|nr:PLP-dependent aminotransferase family protein [Aliiglaciecola lipolytica]MBU2879262.1 PLP-dependent aminotransferase family protein [Aliiglaciecola lipolytica]